jgi:hypothetical protein
MRIVKNYPEFISMNEGAMDMVKKTGETLKKGSDYLRSLMYQVSGKRSNDGKVGTIPAGVTIYPSGADMQSLGINGEVKIEEELIDVDEAVVGLDFPDPKAGVRNVGNDELMEIVNRVLEFPDEPPLMIWGAPGIGKTSITKKVLEAVRDIPPYGGRMIAIQLTTYLPEDFFMPTMKSDDSGDGDVTSKASAWMKKRITRVPQEWLPIYHVSEGEAGNARANGPDGKGGVIFLDELSRASAPVRNVCLGLVQERELDGGWLLGSNWRIISASNRAEDDPTNAKAFGSALGNRFQQVNYSPKFKEDWEPWALKAKTRQGTPLFDRRLLSFLSSRQGQEFFHKMDPKYTTFPSPRSWENAAKSWNNSVEMAQRRGRDLTNDEIRNIVQTSVGQEAADAFLEYLELSNLVDLDSVKNVYTNQANAPLPPAGRGSEKYRADVAYLMAMYASYVHHGRVITPSEINQYIDYLVRLGDATIASVFFTALQDKHPYLGAKSITGLSPEEKASFMAFTLATMQKYLKTYPGAAKELANLDAIKSASTVATS